jgi:hypothetical protein
LATRLQALAALLVDLRHEFPHKPLAVCAIPRPDFAWSVVTAWFPGSRFWVIPSAAEAFDDVKAAFFERQGDAVIRYADDTMVSGWHLRRLWEQGSFEELAKSLPECVRSIYLSPPAQNGR